MYKFYQKSEIWFAVSWILVYVLGTSLADGVSQSIGIAKSATFPLHLIMSLIAVIWISRNGLTRKFGLCRTEISARKFLYYLPLVLLASVNLWFGCRMNMSVPETVLYVGSMLCVGFLEEIIFRGFLFRAMVRDHVKSAILVSSLTFGIGHIVNLFNASGMGLVSTVCQMMYAVAFGYLFVLLFYRGQSLYPCILTHSIINALSAFANEEVMTDEVQIILALVLCVLSIGYALVLRKTLPEADKKQ